MKYDTNTRTQEDARGRFAYVDNVNAEKYGDAYKNKSLDIDHFMRTRPTNAREIAFKNVNYESYGKEMYEKGLKERGKLTSGLQTSGGIGDSNNVDTNTGAGGGSIADAFEQALEQNNTSTSEFFKHFSGD